jgi:NADP-dependent 3-hydroxy acid dehydrogenase YdfG
MNGNGRPDELPYTLCNHGFRARVKKRLWSVFDAGQRETLVQWWHSIEVLTPEDVADAIAYIAAAPTRVNLAEVIIVPAQQG